MSELAVVLVAAKLLFLALPVLCPCHTVEHAPQKICSLGKKTKDAPALPANTLFNITMPTLRNDYRTKQGVDHWLFQARAWATDEFLIKLIN